MYKKLEHLCGPSSLLEQRQNGMSDEKEHNTRSPSSSSKSSVLDNKVDAIPASKEVNVEIDFGEVQVRTRTHWWKLW